MSEIHPSKVVFPPQDGEELVIVTRVVDGDTVKFDWLVSDTARLHGINAPELHGPTQEAGQAAREYLRQLLDGAGASVKVVIKGRDKYGRALLEFFDAQGASINQKMIAAGHAVPYNP